MSKQTKSDKNLNSHEFKKYGEHSQNILPPFLMVRAGALNGWWLAVLCSALSLTLLNTSDFRQSSDFAICFCSFVVTLGLCHGVMSTVTNSRQMKEDIEKIRYKMGEYAKGGYTLNLSETRTFPKLTSLLVQYMSKNDPCFFDYMIAHPESVQGDPETMQDIVIGYLKSHPWDAQKVLDTFPRETMSQRNYNRTARIANRAAHYNMSR